MIIKYYIPLGDGPGYRINCDYKMKIDVRKQVKKKGVCLWDDGHEISWGDYLEYILIKRSGIYLMFLKGGISTKWYKITPDTMKYVHPIPPEFYKQHFFDTLK